MTTKTFKEWSALGYRILKGSKSVGKNAKGEHLFSGEQVWNPEDSAYDTFGMEPSEEDEQNDLDDIWTVNR
jgi:hypothetical protein